MLKVVSLTGLKRLMLSLMIAFPMFNQILLKIGQVRKAIAAQKAVYLQPLLPAFKQKQKGLHPWLELQLSKRSMLWRKKKQQELHTKIAEVTAKLAILQTSHSLVSSNVSSDGMESYFYKGISKEMASLNPQAKEYEPQHKRTFQPKHDLSVPSKKLMEQTRERELYKGPRAPTKPTKNLRYNSPLLNPQMVTQSMPSTQNNNFLP